MMQLYYAPATASMIPHLLLEEIGAAYHRVDVDRENGGHKTAEYLKLNPNGLIPVLIDGDLVLYETAAICLHLCVTHPHAGLAPGLGTHKRAHFYKWLVWLSSTLQSALIIYFYPERYIAAGNTEGSAQVQAQAQARIAVLLEQLDQEFARHGGPWLMGDTFSALDSYAFTLCRWTRNFSNHPARSYPHLGPYLQRVLARPAAQRVMANEGLQAPFF